MFKKEYFLNSLEVGSFRSLGHSNLFRISDFVLRIYNPPPVLKFHTPYGAGFPYLTVLVNRPITVCPVTMISSAIPASAAE